MIVPALSAEARASVGIFKPIPTAADPKKRSEWLLARARCMSAGLRLVLLEIDEIGISLRNGWITPEDAARDLAALEQLPVYIASVFHQTGEAA